MPPQSNANGAESARPPASLLERSQQAMLWAQSGRPEQTLRVFAELAGPAREAGADEVLLRLHYARAVAQHVLGRHAATRDSASEMLTAAQRAGTPLWQSAALSLRATASSALLDTAACLPDLVDAQIMLEAGGADDERSLAHAYAVTGLAIGYDTLRLYELALPHYRRALALEVDGAGSEVPAVARMNLAETQLRWALELEQIGRQESAVRLAADAGAHAKAALVLCTGLPARWDAQARMLLGCALAISGDPTAAANLLEPATTQLAEGGFILDAHVGQVLLARAYRRRDELERAAQIARAAVEEAPGDLPWPGRAAAMAERARVEAALSGQTPRALGMYAHLLARTLWSERTRLLRAVQAQLDLRRHDLHGLDGLHNLDGLDGLHDRLTGLATRRALPEVLARLAQDGPLPATALVLDLDDLASVNSLAGHPRGDDVLRWVSSLLVDNARGAEVIARLDDDRFAVVLPGTGLSQGGQVAERVLLTIRDHAWTETAGVPAVTASVGVAVAENELELPGLVERAERAMTAAQRAGGDGLRLAPPAAVTPTR